MNDCLLVIMGRCKKCSEKSRLKKWCTDHYVPLFIKHMIVLWDNKNETETTTMNCFLGFQTQKPAFFSKRKKEFTQNYSAVWKQLNHFNIQHQPMSFVIKMWWYWEWAQYNKNTSYQIHSFGTSKHNISFYKTEKWIWPIYLHHVKFCQSKTSGGCLHKLGLQWHLQSDCIKYTADHKPNP